MMALNPLSFAFWIEYLMSLPPNPFNCFDGETLTGPNVIVGSDLLL